MPQLQTIIEKLDKLDSRIDNIDVTLAKQEGQLAEHIRRTELLEKKLEPIDTHVKMVNGVLKFLGILSLILTVLKALKIIE